MSSISYQPYTPQIRIAFETHYMAEMMSSGKGRELDIYDVFAWAFMNVLFIALSSCQIRKIGLRMHRECRDYFPATTG